MIKILLNDKKSLNLTRRGNFTKNSLRSLKSITNFNEENGEENQTDFTKLLTDFSKVYELSSTLEHNFKIANFLVKKNRKFFKYYKSL